MAQLGIRRPPIRRFCGKRARRSSRLLLAICTIALLGSHSRPVPAADLPALEQLYDTGQYVDAEQAAREALAGHQYDPGYAVLHIRAQLAQGKYPAALASFQAAQQRYPVSLAIRLLGRDVYLVNDQPQQAQQQLAAIQDMVRQTPWRYSDAASRVLIGRTLLLTGADPREVFEALYDKARKERPQMLDPYVASAELALDKQDDALAAETLAKALKIAPDNADLHYLLGRALASSNAARSASELAKAVELNLRHVPALLTQVDQALDDEDTAEAASLLDAILQVNPHEPLAWAYRSLLAALAGDAEGELAYRYQALEPWRTNPHVDHLIGRRLARNYRFAQAAAAQQRALELAPDFLPAKIELSQDLLRLGDEAAGWRLADEALERDGYNVVAHNLTALEAALSKFRTLEAPGLIVRMDAHEADIYGPRVLDLLRLAREKLCAKFQVELAEPVVVEIFPEQKDFAIRTFGLPGGFGLLGVCFGRVITANSPAAQAATPANWQAVLWHEFCHVVTLTKTRNKMPRWLSEGISVYEERQQDPTWGQGLRPDYCRRLLAADLPPPSKLSASFLKPATPLDLQFAYFESSLVVEYLVERYGPVAIERILLDLADDVPINQCLARHTEQIDQLDADFAAYARAKATAYAPGADWSELALPADAEPEALAAWNREHPLHFQGLRREAERLVAAKKWDAAKAALAAIANLDAPTALALLARVHRELGETAEERAALDKLAGLENDATSAYQRLIELAAAAEDWPAVERNALRILAVNPLGPEPYRRLAQAAELLEHRDRAISARQALLLVDPEDAAENHFRLAQLYRAQGNLPAARRHVLQSLEETPRYRAAQRLLLEIAGRGAEKSP